MQDPDKLNDDTTYQRCFACGQRNPHGLQLVFHRDAGRVATEFTPKEHHQGFPGVVHGGIIAALLDETLGRTGAIRREWLITGRLDIRYRQPAPIERSLRVWGAIVRQRKGAIDASGAVELDDGTVVAEARGLFLELPQLVATEVLSRYPEFANYWAR